MIRFKQKEFLTNFTRISAKTHRLGRRFGLLNPVKYATKKGRDSFNKEIRSLNGDVRLATSKLNKNIKDVGDATKSVVKKGDIKKASNHVGSLLNRTPIATVGPAIPFPGTTEALGVVGPYVGQFTPAGEVTRSIMNPVRKGLGVVGKSFKNLSHKSRKYVL